jgi:hypothetical protein
LLIFLRILGYAQVTQRHDCRKPEILDSRHKI